MTRTGFEDGLFAAWRNDPDFVLNRPTARAPASWSPGPTSAPARPASTPCGRCSDYGFRVVISPRFADIFRGNAGKGGLVTACVGQPDVEELWAAAGRRPGDRGDRRPRRAHRVLGRRVRAVRPRRLHPLAADGGPRRRRPDAPPRRRVASSRPGGPPGCRQLPEPATCHGPAPVGSAESFETQQEKGTSVVVSCAVAPNVAANRAIARHRHPRRVLT